MWFNKTKGPTKSHVPLYIKTDSHLFIPIQWLTALCLKLVWHSIQKSFMQKHWFYCIYYIKIIMYSPKFFSVSLSVSSHIWPDVSVEWNSLLCCDIPLIQREVIFNPIPIKEAYLPPGSDDNISSVFSHFVRKLRSFWKYQHC